jgi:hypothetical protein
MKSIVFNDMDLLIKKKKIARKEQNRKLAKLLFLFLCSCPKTLVYVKSYVILLSLGPLFFFIYFFCQLILLYFLLLLVFLPLFRKHVFVKQKESFHLIVKWKQKSRYFII